MSNEIVVRIRIPPHLMKRYRLICLHSDLSVPKQTTALIRQFVEAQESYVSLIQEAKRNAMTASKS